jgi:hypothetical protein
MKFLERLLPSIPMLVLSFPLAACKSTVIGCQDDGDDSAVLPDGSFQEDPTQWTLAPHSTIDDQLGVCGGSRSLRLALGQGAGPADLTRSAPFAGLVPDKEYEITFHYRYQSCKDATAFVFVGTYEHQVTFQGSDGAWGETSFTVKPGAEPVWVDIRPGRTGDAAAYATPEHDGNLIWVDGFSITEM